MRFSIRYADKLVGTFVILALAILIFVIFMLGSNQRWFVKDYEYKTYFDSASGLSVNMPILFRGFTIGHVKKMSLAEDDRVEVIFSIFEEYTQRVREGSLVEVQISPIGLGNTFIFHPGNSENDLIPEGMEIYEINSDKGREQIRSGVSSVTDTTDNINAIMSQVRILLENLNLALSGSDGAQDLELGQLIAELNQTLANVSKITGTLARHFDPIMGDVGKVTGQIADPTGTIMAMLDAQGPIYSALNSLAGIIDSLDKSVELIPSQFPQLGVLFSQLYVTLNQVQDVLVAVANNPLLRGGIPQRVETSPGGASPRNMEF